MDMILMIFDQYSYLAHIANNINVLPVVHGHTPHAQLGRSTHNTNCVSKATSQSQENYHQL